MTTLRVRENDRIPDDVRSEKECRRCHRVLALGAPETSEFYVKWNRRVDGSKHYYWSPECRSCWNQMVRDRREARQARIGDAAFRAAQKEIRDRWMGITLKAPIPAPSGSDLHAAAVSGAAVLDHLRQASQPRFVKNEAGRYVHAPPVEKEATG